MSPFQFQESDEGSENKEAFRAPPVGEKGPEVQASSEKPSGFDFKFYVTDHSPDFADTSSPEKLKALYADIKSDGVQSVRYDWHWNKVEPQPGQFSQPHLERYTQAKTIMAEAGLEPPTIILSNPPKWAQEIYHSDKDKFYEEYKAYVETVRDSLAQAGGEKISRIQILNELNVNTYTPIAVEDLPRMCQITREAFKDYNPDLKLAVTVLAANGAKYAGTAVEDFLPKLKEVKDNFDIVGIDYYPGSWHSKVIGSLSEGPQKIVKALGSLLINPQETFKAEVKNLDLLEKVFREVATWGKEYELSEVGLPTKWPWGGEKEQRYFYGAFFREYKHLMIDFRQEGLALPTRVGFYEAVDEEPRTPLGELLRKTPFPENDWGVRDSTGKRKMVLQGSQRTSEGKKVGNQRPQLSNIIDYLRAPMEKR